MTFQDQLDQFREAVKETNTENTYSARSYLPDGDYRIGAYGIRESSWDSMATIAGYENAWWGDEEAQDRIAEAKFATDFMQYQNWMLTAIAFEYGTDFADKLAAQGATTPEKVAALGYEGVARWLGRFQENAAGLGTSFTDVGLAAVLGMPSPSSGSGTRTITLPEVQFVPEQAEPEPDIPNYDRAAHALRGILTSMRDAERGGRKIESAIDTQEVIVGDSG